MKKIICLVLAVSAVFMLSGCAQKGAENYISDYYSSWGKGEMTPEKSYDECISATSKELLNINKEQYVNSLTAMLNEKKVVYKSISIKPKSVVAYDDHIYKIKGEIEAESFGAPIKIPVTDYIINEDGKYKFLQYGVSSKELTDTSFSSEAFSVSMDVMYSGPDRLMINLIAKNPTTSNYSVGYGGDARLVVETDQGSYEQIMPGMNVVKARDSNQGTQTVDNVKGIVKKITLLNVYELTPNNEPKDKSNSRSYVIYERK